MGKDMLWRNRAQCQKQGKRSHNDATIPDGSAALGSPGYRLPPGYTPESTPAKSDVSSKMRDFLVSKMIELIRQTHWHEIIVNKTMAWVYNAGSPTCSAQAGLHPQSSTLEVIHLSLSFSIDYRRPVSNHALGIRNMALGQTQVHHHLHLQP